jgi:guanylate kinase
MTDLKDKPNPLLIVISAPSGGGKTTLCQQLLAANPDLTRAVTCTTRPPRPGEKEGVDYYFLDSATFARRAQAGEFLEYATVFGQSYGTLKSDVLTALRSGIDLLLNIDVQGAATIREKSREEPDLERALVEVFLTPTSLSILEQRLQKRATDSEAVIEKRIGVARNEIAQWKRFNYLIISTTIAEDLRRMQCILEAERMRTSRARPPDP